MRRLTGIPIVNARRCFDCSRYDSFTLREYQHRALFVFCYATCSVSIYKHKMTQIYDAPRNLCYFLSLAYCGLKNFHVLFLINFLEFM